MPSWGCAVRMCCTVLKVVSLTCAKYGEISSIDYDTDSLDILALGQALVKYTAEASAAVRCLFQGAENRYCRRVLEPGWFALFVFFCRL